MQNELQLNYKDEQQILLEQRAILRHRCSINEQVHNDTIAQLAVIEHRLNELDRITENGISAYFDTVPTDYYDFEP